MRVLKIFSLSFMTMRFSFTIHLLRSVTFPTIKNIDIIFEKGVFERIPREKVEYYIKSLKDNYLRSDGIMILYFLMDRGNLYYY